VWDASCHGRCNIGAPGHYCESCCQVRSSAKGTRKADPEMRDAAREPPSKRGRPRKVAGTAETATEAPAEPSAEAPHGPWTIDQVCQRHHPAGIRRAMMCVMKDDVRAP
jgi:hypothetical protein